MKVQLKNVKVCEWASEETNCFDATIWINGKRAGEASNDGRGGSTMLHFHDAGLGAAFTEWAKKQPPLPSEHFPEGLAMDAELYIDLLLDEFLKEKDRKRIAKTAEKERQRLAAKGFLTVQIEFGDQILWVGIRKPEDRLLAESKMQEKYKFKECRSTILEAPKC